MANIGKIKPQQISKARRIIAVLPQRNIFCSREEAAEQLADDFRLAFKKGYSPKEVCAMLKYYGLLIPEEIVARYQLEAEDDDDEINLNELLQACGNAGGKNKSARGKKSSTGELEKQPRDEGKNGKAFGEISTDMPEKNSEPALKKQSGEDEILNVSPRKFEDAQIEIEPVAPKTEQNEGKFEDTAREKLSLEPEKTENAVKETLRPAQTDDVEIILKNGNARAKSNMTLDKSDKSDVKNPMSQNQKIATDSDNLKADTGDKPPESRPKAWDEDLENWHSPLNDTSGYGTFTVKPDTPIGEL